jgi:hypothetical protein
VGAGRRLPMVAGTKGAVPLDRGHDGGRGVGNNAAGSLSRGYQWAPLRTLVARAGVWTHVAGSPMPVHDGEGCRPLLTHRPALRTGEVLREARGFLEGARLAGLTPERHVDVMVPLRSNMIALHEACSVAERAGQGHPPPSRAAHQLAWVPQVQHGWDTWRGPVHAGVMRYGQAKKHTEGSMVLVTTAQEGTAPGIVQH